MAIIEGTVFSGKYSELTILTSNLPTSVGASSRRRSARQVATASANKSQTKIGVALRKYSSYLASLLGTEDF